MKIQKTSMAASEHTTAQNLAVIENSTGPRPGDSWLERKLRPSKITQRYPIKGKWLLYSTCAFGSLGDALFGYNSGIMSGLLVNPVFIKKFFFGYGGANGTLDAVDPAITGISVACLQASAAIGALIAGRLGDLIGRKKCVRVGGFIYFFSAFMQIFAPDFATFVSIPRPFPSCGCVC